MKEIFIENNKLKEKIYNILDKKYNEDLSLNDLQNIKDITLHKKNIDGSENQYTLTDFYNLKYIESLTLNDFVIDDNMIDIINSLLNLKEIVFNFCEWKNTKLINLGLQHLVITNSEINYLLLANNSYLKKITLIGINEINLKDLINMKYIESINIHDSNIINCYEFKNFLNLKKLNLDGSKLDSEKILEKLKPNINISFNKMYFYM